MKESHGMENIVLDVLYGHVIPVIPAVPAKVYDLTSSTSPDLTPTALVAGCEAEHDLQFSFLCSPGLTRGNQDNLLGDFSV